MTTPVAGACMLALVLYAYPFGVDSCLLPGLLSGLHVLLCLFSVGLEEQHGDPNCHVYFLLLCCHFCCLQNTSTSFSIFKSASYWHFFFDILLLLFFYHFSSICKSLATWRHAYRRLRGGKTHGDLINDWDLDVIWMLPGCYLDVIWDVHVIVIVMGHGPQP